MYPNIEDYINAIKHIQHRLLSQSFSYVEDPANKEPQFFSGNFSVVFHVKDEIDKHYAIKCFTIETKDRLARYQAISTYLEQHKSNYFVAYEYLEKELFVTSNSAGDNEFPILKMEWAHGKTLAMTLQEACKKHDIHILNIICEEWDKLCQFLLDHEIAHGDLKHDNIIVTNDHKLILIDYDGMFVPQLKKMNANEIGSSAYQHPKRNHSTFNKDMDHFSMLVIKLSLHALKHNPELFNQYNTGENIIFSKKDFDNVADSHLVKEIKQLNNSFINLLVQNLQKFCSSENIANPNINEIVGAKKNGSWHRWLKFNISFTILLLLCFFCSFLFICSYLINETNIIDEENIIPAVPDQGNLYMDFADIEGEFLPSNKDKRFFVIRGNVINCYQNSRSKILISAKLFSKEDKLEDEEDINKMICVSKYQEVYAGNILFNKEILRLDKDYIITYLTQRNNKCINSSNLIPFLFVFFDLPPNLEEYSVQVVSSDTCIELTQTQSKTDINAKGADAMITDVPDQGNFYMDFADIEDEFIENKIDKRCFVIRGNVINSYRSSRSKIIIAAKLFSREEQFDDEADVNKQFILSKYQEVFAGNILFNKEIQKIDKDNIYRYLTHTNNKCVKSNERIPFLFVFFDLPPNLVEYSVQAISSETCVDVKN